MHKMFEINRTKIKGSCKSGRKVVTQNSKSDLTLVLYIKFRVLFLSCFKADSGMLIHMPNFECCHFFIVMTTKWHLFYFVIAALK